MKNNTLIAIFIFFFTLISTAEVLTGVYTLNGKNPRSEAGLASPGYVGNVVIEKKGRIYLLYWFIDKKQSKHGMGDLKGNVLDVVYFDDSGKNGRSGSVIFNVSGNNLTGKWKSDFSTTDNWGEEQLTFETALVPEELKPHD